MQLYKLLQTQEYRQVDRSRMKTIASPVSEVQGLVDKFLIFNLFFSEPIVFISIKYKPEAPTTAL